MLIPNHPDDELLAAFADADPEATGDAGVSTHLATCDRCSTLVDDLRGLTTALASLPDLEPSRPLRFVPPAAGPRPGFADRVGGVIRGIFAPALTAGAALALVGAVGTAAPAFSGAAGGAAPQALDAQQEVAPESSGETRDGAEPSAAAAPAASEPAATEDLSTLGGEAGQSSAPGFANADPSADETPMTAERVDETAADEADEVFTATGDDRPIWPMLLFTGVAIIVATLLLRWILVPRAA
jgi:hypothetical protein